MNSIIEKLYDANARIERVIFLAGALAGQDAFADDLNEFFDDEDVETIEECLGGIPTWVDLGASRWERSDDIYEWLTAAGKLGFLVQFATPVMTKRTEFARSFSWGYYKTKWFYAETIDEAIAKGLAWIEECRAAEDRDFKPAEELP